MKPLVQTSYEEPTDETSLGDEALVVHRRPQEHNNRALVLFVHGLGGRRYGKKATWGRFPAFVYEDFPDVDVALYSYRTLIRRLKFWESIDLEAEAHVLADMLRDLPDYERLVLVGHSMGGLLCKAAICHWLVSGQREVLSRVRGLILMATPQTGSQRVPRFLTWLSNDFHALRPHGPFVSRITQTFTDHLVLDDKVVATGKAVLPTWAILGASDFWVDRLSAGLGLDARRTKLARGSHTDIVKPQTKENDVYAFVRQCLIRCLRVASEATERGEEPCDVFVSYDNRDADQVGPVREALERAGLRVWGGKNRGEDSKSIQRDIENGVAKSKTLLAWYSVRYAESRACQWELSAAFLAAELDGDVHRRILVVNPETSDTHVCPEELRVGLKAFRTRADLEATVDTVRRHVAQVTGAPGGLCSLAKPEWYGGASGIGSNRFVGRARKLWEIYSGLQAHKFVILAGMGGAGKSLLAEEYAIRFGAAYPGGVFWLKALGHDAARSMDAQEREAERQRQFARLAEFLGIPTKERSFPEIRADLGERLTQLCGRYLWVVDDFPSLTSWKAVQDWLAPTQDGRTLITTRSAAHDWAGKQIEVEELEPSAAYTLLTYRRAPKDETEKSAAEALAMDLGYHALALELAAVAAEGPGYAEFRRRLADQSKDRMDFAAELFGRAGSTLPHREGVNLNIAKTLLVSTETLSSAGMDFLRLASQLAPAPIPRGLMARAFAAANGTRIEDAADMADVARREVESRSLARAVTEAALKVHTLISRTVRFHDKATNRRRVLRRGAAIALLETLQPEAETPEQARLADVVEHARAVVLFIADDGAELDKDEARLLARLVQELGQRDDKLYTDFNYARALREKVLEISLRVLGEQDDNTVIAMNELAVLLFAYGHLAEAQAGHEKVLKLIRLTRGEEHRDTVVAMTNLAEALESPGGDPARAQALRSVIAEISPRAKGKGILRFNPP